MYQVTSNTVKSKAKLYEERIVILKATSFDDAIIEAEAEATNYAGKGTGLKYLGFDSVFRLFDDKITNRTEVFSLMRESSLTDKKYIDKYFDTGKERTKRG